MTNKITSIMYWPFEYISFVCSYSKQWAKECPECTFVPCVLVCARVCMCVWVPAWALHFLSLSLPEFIPYSIYVHCLSPKFSKQCKTRASEKRCLMTLVCWILLSSPIARRAPVPESPSLALPRRGFCLLKIKTLYKLPFHPGGGVCFCRISSD